MMKFTGVAALVLACTVMVKAQDEGTIVKRERIDKDNGIFLGLGGSATTGKNIGDYKIGFNVELGFQKRLNRIFSIGPSLSYQNFQYDPEETNKDRNAYVGTGDPANWKTKYNLQSANYDYGYVLTLDGGDLNLISLGVNLKLNFVPIKENSKFSVYGFAKPFVSVASRGEVNGSDQRYTYEIYEDINNTPTNPNDDVLHFNLNNDTLYPDQLYNADKNQNTWGPNEYDALKSKTKVTGGIFLGPGIELFPNNTFSFFLQAAFGYTFPVNYVSTESYETTVTSYVDENFPMTTKGFPSINVQFGGSFNF